MPLFLRDDRRRTRFCSLLFVLALTVDVVAAQPPFHTPSPVYRPPTASGFAGHAPAPTGPSFGVPGVSPVRVGAPFVHRYGGPPAPYWAAPAPTPPLSAPAPSTQAAASPGPRVSYAFRYDAAENLDQIRRTGRCGTTTTELPPDPRNRPASIDGDALTWDAAGRLREKGEHRFIYDAHGLLVEVRRVGDDAVVASYAYDILNRRISRTVNGTTHRTVWDGWRALEEYKLVDGGAPLLTSRRTFGTGLDHILELEQRLPAGLATFHPVYD
ncbi:MAG: hypothetical protein AAFX50_22705, partial [Acidobacteriota bacterium]